MDSVATPLPETERRAALDLVAEIQERREGTRINPSRVPHVLLPYQQRWHADQTQVRIAEKSRRIGWSWGALAAESALEAGSQNGMDQFYMGYNMAMAAEYIGDCAFFLKAFQLSLEAMSAIDVYRVTETVKVERLDPATKTVVVENEKRDIVTYRIRTAAGFKIEALSSAPHNWRGRQGHARIDEAAFHQNLGEVVKGALAFRMWGGRIDIVSTHNGEDNEFNGFVKDVKARKLPWSLHSVSFDGALRDGFFRRVCLVRGVDWSKEAEVAYRADIYADYPRREDADEELGVIPKRGSGAYFSRMLIEGCQDETIPVLRFAKPAGFVTDPTRDAVAQEWIEAMLLPVIREMSTGKRTVLGQDFGRDGDLSVILVLQQEDASLWRAAFMVELRRIPFDVQQKILFAIGDNLPLFWHGKLDARGNGQSHAEAALQKYGATRIDCVKATTQWYAEHFPPYRRAYEDRSIRMPGGEDVIADHRRVHLVNGSPAVDDKHDKGSDGEQRHGDSAIAGVLAWAAARSDGVPVEHRSSGVVRAGHGGFAAPAGTEVAGGGGFGMDGFVEGRGMNGFL